MPKYVKASSSCVIRADLVVNSELVTPDDGTVSVTLYDTNGSTISGYTDVLVELPLGGTSVQYVVPAEVNELPSGGAAHRYVEFKFVYGEQNYTTSDQYELVNRVMFPVTPHDVRTKLGLQAAELEDNEVDFIGAYRKIQKAMPSVDFEARFVSGDYDLTYLKNLLVAVAALSVLPSLQLRVSSQEQVDNTIWRRLSKIDFETLEAQLKSEVDAETFNLTQDDGTGLIILALLAVGTDAVTGAEA